VTSASPARKRGQGGGVRGARVACLLNVSRDHHLDLGIISLDVGHMSRAVNDQHMSYTCKYAISDKPFGLLPPCAQLRVPPS